jgi:hypothetical protein
MGGTPSMPRKVLSLAQKRRQAAWRRKSGDGERAHPLRSLWK